MMTRQGRNEEARRRGKRVRRLVETRSRALRIVAAGLMIVLASVMLCTLQPRQGEAMAAERNACDAERRLASDIAGSQGGYVAVVSAWGNTCHAVFDWPVRKPVSTLRAYDGPAQPWLSGHRGVDLAAKAGEDLLAPGDGVISFAGKVAGKDVVSMKYGKMVLTFEPAVTDMDAGASVRRGQRFAKVGERSDHCDDVCLHWGIRDGEKTYLDPASMTSPYRIVLKPGRR